MPTFNQLKSIRRLVKIRKNRKVALAGCPQKKGFCLKIVIRSPKKPNSARRKTARVFLTSNKKRVYCSIIGMGPHGLQKHSSVLIRGGRRRDIPGVKYVIIRGKFDLPGLSSRRTSRSKYGLKKIK